VAVLLSCDAVSKTYGVRPLFERISVAISEGDRLGIIGPNGSGKSTLVEILAGIKKPDEGVVSLRKLTRLAYVPQDSVFAPGISILQVLESAAANLHIDEHERESLIHETMGKTGFANPEAIANTLSGGWRKRLAIAAELVKGPDVLLLDEPTNHLDLEGILWLEKLLTGARFASLIVSHDRYFLENVATHMAEINRAYPGGLFYVRGSYAEFLEKKTAFLHAQSQQQEALENKVRGELEWLRRGPKARTTKSKARIQSAGRLMEELSDINYRTQTSTAQIDFTASDRRTKKLISTEHLAKALGGKPLFGDLNQVLKPGMRLGLVGPNGSGKTTLLKLLAGEMQPDTGIIERADLLQIITFEQTRDTLDPSATLQRALAPEGDIVIYRDRPIHVNGWAKRFLFRDEQLEMPVASLSGGERARVLIARLMLRSADLLLLDEPTNDLDIPTLELLEESLMEFSGALVLVTHDRYMLDRVSTLVLGLDGEGGSQIYADYSQWEDARSRQRRAAPKANLPASAPAAPSKKKLSYIEQREWEQMESHIMEAEAELEQFQAALQDPQVVSDASALQRNYEQMQSAQARVDELYARWADLEARRA
jgi:ABC transport system ATP-binding/permease protein